MNYDQADFMVLMNSPLPCSCADDDDMRFDSAESAALYFVNELNHIKAKTYDKRYPQLTALKHFPVSSEANAGAESITYYSYDKEGSAKVIAPNATDLPRVNVSGTPTTIHPKNIGVAYHYTHQDLRASRMAGKSLDARLASAAKWYVDKATNDIAWVGDEESGLLGVLSPTNSVPVYVLGTNAAGTSTAFEDKTPGEILADISAMFRYVSFNTLGVEEPDTLLLPINAYKHLFDTPRSDASDMSVGKWLMENLPWLKRIEYAPELNSNSDVVSGIFPGMGVGFLYKKDADKFTVEIPMPFYQHPIQPRNLEFVIPCESRVAGVLMYYPMSALIIPGV